MELKTFGEFLKKNSRILLIILFLAVGVIILASSAAKSDKNEAEIQTLEEYRVDLEERIAKNCSSVRGVGKCKVIITFERGEQNSYKGSTLTEVKPPKVLGVSVICEGADSDSVRYALTQMLTALFDIGANRISILKLK